MAQEQSVSPLGGRGPGINFYQCHEMTLSNAVRLIHPLAQCIIYHIYSTLSWAIENIREAGVAFHLHQDIPKRHSENKTYERVSVCGQKR